jgi:hypothetical protein
VKSLSQPGLGGNLLSLAPSEFLDPSDDSRLIRERIQELAVEPLDALHKWTLQLS